ncbi:hypothetical protein AA0311_1418 [Asaia bogorensis NBRC 16594]|nr:hypothetical protein AA0311_1418 [Asaia bogorensis NBRC 16594]
MIKGTVFLHQDNDMLDIPDRAGFTIGRDGEGLTQVFWQHGPCQRGSTEMKEMPTAGFHADCSGTQLKCLRIVKKTMRGAAA